MRAIIFAVTLLLTACGGGGSSTQPVAQQKTVIVTLGDSETQGYIPCSTGACLSPTDAYPAVLQRLLGDTFSIQNLGVGGYTSKDIMEKKLQEALMLKPNIIVLMDGANDNERLTLDESVQYNRLTIQTLQQAGIRVYVLSLVYPTKSQYVDEFNARQSLLAMQSGARFIDLRALDHPEWFACQVPQNPHPCKEGYMAIAEAVKKAILS